MDRQIDALVYELYRLTQEEIKFMEESFEVESLLESKRDEYRELRWRYRWLLHHHPQFLRDWMEVKKDGEYRIRSFDAARDPNFLCEKRLPCNGFRRELDRWSLGFMTSPEEAENFLIERDLVDLEAGKRFLERYRLVESNSVNLDWELSKLKRSADEGGWDIRAKSFKFKLYAWWYELREEGKSEPEICNLTGERRPRMVDYRALKFMYRRWPKEFKELCRFAKIHVSGDERTFYYLLAFLRRGYKIVEAKKDFISQQFGWMSAKEGRMEFRKNQKYLVRDDFPFDVEEWFENVVIRLASKELLDDFLDARKKYLRTGDGSSIAAMIRQGVHRMQERIDCLRLL